jgi:hypothetical protein
VHGKLAPRYIGPFLIIKNKKVGVLVYKLQLPQEMSDVHDVFHVSQLKKCLRIPEEQVTPETIDLQGDLIYQEVPIRILNTVTRRIRNSTFRICRVQWSRHSETEATWEREDALRVEFLNIFLDQAKYQGRDST